MRKRNIEIQRILNERYGHLKLDELDKLLLDEMSIAPVDCDFEDEMLAWLNANPDADLQSAAIYEESFFPKFEIVDDDDLDEYDEED